MSPEKGSRARPRKHPEAGRPLAAALFRLIGREADAIADTASQVSHATRTAH